MFVAVGIPTVVGQVVKLRPASSIAASRARQARCSCSPVAVQLALRGSDTREHNVYLILMPLATIVSGFDILSRSSRRPRAWYISALPYCIVASI